MKGWVIPSGKDQRPAEVLAEGRGNTEWVVEEGSSKYHLKPHDQLWKLRITIDMSASAVFC